jgi:hypothetical protein
VANLATELGLSIRWCNRSNISQSALVPAVPPPAATAVPAVVAAVPAVPAQSPVLNWISYYDISAARYVCKNMYV